MKQVEEIEAAIERLSLEDYRRIAEWIRERDHKLWDEQMDAGNSVSGLPGNEVPGHEAILVTLSCAPGRSPTAHEDLFVVAPGAPVKGVAADEASPL
jgi:hypothetical protein